MGAPPRNTILQDGLQVVPGSKFSLRPWKYQHGTRSAYIAGCCCPACTEAQAVYTRLRRQESLGRPTRPYRTKPLKQEP